MRVLVTGGAGYIGSHTVVQLVAAGHHPIIVDDFSNSHPTALDRIAEISGQPVAYRMLDVADSTALDRVFAQERFDAVIHFAGRKAVAESVADPLMYYRTNLNCTIAVAEAMHRHGVDILIFSSSATVYGPAGTPPLSESAPTSASNPYGWTKVMSEQILRDAAAQHHPRRVALLRYFNPVGAHPSGLIGEGPRDTPNNLAPLIAQVASHRLARLKVYGADYATPDGTCLRDYIHVDDLAAGHIAALEVLKRGDAGVRTWNLGTGEPTSVLEMLRAFERAVGSSIPYEIAERRPGDVAVSYADPSLAQRDLNWRAKRGVDDMCTDAWRWHSHNPGGYESSPRTAEPKYV